MFNSVTWSIGFAAATLAFILSVFFEFKSGLNILHPELVILASMVGLVLCIYTSMLIEESKKHIKANWDRARKCRVHLPGFSQEFFDTKAEYFGVSGTDGVRVKICDQVYWIVAAFALLFFMLMFYSYSKIS